MYCTYLLALFILVGIDRGASLQEDSEDNETAELQISNDRLGNWFQVTAHLYSVDSKQIDELEIALNSVFRRFLEQPPEPLSLRSINTAPSDLSKSIRTIGDAISNEITNLWKKFGLRSAKGKRFDNYKSIDHDNLKVSIYYQLLRFPLDLSPIGREIITHIKRHLRKNKYTSLGYQSRKYGIERNYNNPTEDLKVAEIFGIIRNYTTNSYICLEQNVSTPFDFKQAIGNLTNFSPQVTARILKARLRRPVPKNSLENNREFNEFHAFVCHVTVENKQRDFYKCLEEVKRVDKCVLTKLGNSSKDLPAPVSTSSQDFGRAMKELNGNCNATKSRKDFSTNCRLKSKATTGNEFPYVLDFFMGDLKKSPGLSRMANELGSIVKRTQMGSEAMNEVVKLIEIYKPAMEKKAKFLRAPKLDGFQTYRYKRMSNNLAVFERYVSQEALKTVGYAHDVMSIVENLFVDSASKATRVNLSDHLKALKCWSEFMNFFFADWMQIPNRFPNKPKEPIAPIIVNEDHKHEHSKNTELAGLIKVRNDIGLVKKSQEEPLNKLIASMKRLGESTSPRRSTALITIANTFLLATMFYECIAVLAAAIYRDDTNPVIQPTTTEHYSTDYWPSRNTRSLPETNEEYLDPQESENKTESLYVTNEMEEINSTTVKPEYEGILETVGNTSEIETVKTLDDEEFEETLK